MEKKQTPKKTKKTSNVIYHVSWSVYNREFNTEKERDYFIKHYIGNVEYKTWESEVD